MPMISCKNGRQWLLSRLLIKLLHINGLIDYGVSSAQKPMPLHSGLMSLKSSLLWGRPLLSFRFRGWIFQTVVIFKATMDKFLTQAYPITNHLLVVP